MAVWRDFEHLLPTTYMSGLSDLNLVTPSALLELITRLNYDVDTIRPLFCVTRYLYYQFGTIVDLWGPVQKVVFTLLPTLKYVSLLELLERAFSI